MASGGFGYFYVILSAPSDWGGGYDSTALGYVPVKHLYTLHYTLLAVNTAAIYYK